MIMYAIGKLFSQLYYNDCENRLLRRLRKKKSRKQVRIRAPFDISYPELIDIGDNTEILKNARINLYPYLAKDEPHLSIGKNCYIGRRVSFLMAADITLGNDVLVADDVTFVSHNHGINPEDNTPYKDQELVEVKPILVGDNCWFAEKAVIMPGVTIGRGCVIGAMSVVDRNVPDYCVVAGVPAKIIKRYDFNEHEWKKYEG